MRFVRAIWQASFDCSPEAAGYLQLECRNLPRPASPLPYLSPCSAGFAAELRSDLAAVGLLVIFGLVALQPALRGRAELRRRILSAPSIGDYAVDSVHNLVIIGFASSG